MSNVRVNQRNVEGYNPDGAPGTITTGVPGPDPTDDQVRAAVTEYLTVNPPTYPLGPPVAVDSNRFGLGATGQPGSYVDVGSQGTLDGHVSVGGTVPTANLVLSSKAGRVVLTGTAWVQGPLMVDGMLSFPDITVAQAGAGASATVDVTDHVGAYRPVRASAFTVTSDRSLKDFIAPLTGGLNEVLTTQSYSYRMSGEWRRGLIADEAPLGVRHEGDGIGMLDLYSIVATLWCAVRELNDRMIGMGKCSRFLPTE